MQKHFRKYYPEGKDPYSFRELNYFNISYWLEVKGFKRIYPCQCGSFGGGICRITGEKKLIDSAKYTEYRFWRFKPSARKCQMTEWEDRFKEPRFNFQK